MIFTQEPLASLRSTAINDVEIHLYPDGSRCYIVIDREAESVALIDPVLMNRELYAVLAKKRFKVESVIYTGEKLSVHGKTIIMRVFGDSVRFHSPESVDQEAEELELPLTANLTAKAALLRFGAGATLVPVLGDCVFCGNLAVQDPAMSETVRENREAALRGLTESLRVKGLRPKALPGRGPLSLIG